LLERAKSADIAVAFASAAGVRKILPALQRTAKRAGVRLIIGLYQDITEPAALQQVLRAQSATNQKLSARISRNRKFHSKLYILKARSTLTVFIGSSNLSVEGLSSAGELIASLTLAAGTAPAFQVATEFDRMWEHASPLNTDLLKRYANRYERLRRPEQPADLPSFTDVLGPITPERHDKDDRPRKWWRDSIQSYAEPVTETIIGQETDWGKKGWRWYCSPNHQFGPGDRILLFDFTIKQLYLAQVTDTVECHTPDGTHFVAFRRLSGFHWRKMIPALWTTLKDDNVVTSKKRALPRRPLGKAGHTAILRLLKKAR
jgi:HKD family nuclease